MKEKSIKYNFIFNFIRVLTNVLFPLITMPYLARVLQPENIGKVEFSNSIIQYFILIASLGIPIYGIREIAKVRDNEEKISQTLSELFIINLIMTALSYIIFIILLFSVEKMHKESILFLVMSFNIIFTTIGIEWYYQGIEKFDYITIRSVLIKIISIFLIFIFVKDKSDYIVSAIITTVGTVGNNLFNIYKAKNLINFKTIKKNIIRIHLKNVTITFSMLLATSIYVYLTNVILGFIKGEKEVAFYSFSYKLMNIILSLLTSLGTVVIPRVTFLIKENKKNEYNKLIEKVINLSLFFSLPIIVLIFFFSGNFIIIIFGKEYIPMIYAFKIMSINLFATSISYILSNQVLYPNNKEKLILKSVIIGAILNIGLNLVLIPKLSFIGASISVVVTEIIVLTFKFKWSKPFVKLSTTVLIKKYIFSTVIMYLFIFLIKGYTSTINSIIILGIFSLVIYSSVLWRLKERFFVLEVMRYIRSKIN